MTLLNWLGILIVVLTVVALSKRWETRIVLLASGMLMCCLSLEPMTALNAFAQSMTRGSLITAICTSMGFAMVLTYTKCDQHLVALLARPIKGLGIFLMPVCTAVTILINIVIPSAAGVAAAVGSTLIPVMLRAGIRPEGAAAAVMMGTIGGVLSPGSSHNPYVAKMANMEVMDFIGLHFPYSAMMFAVAILGILAVAVVFKDKSSDSGSRAIDESKKVTLIEKPNLIYAFIPVLPVLILFLGNTVIPVMKMGVAQAMLLGTIICLFVTRVDPQEFSKSFFNGLGRGYGEILGIIIAAGVFAAGLQATGLVAAFVELLKESNEIARWGGSIGPWMLGVITGSGDASTFAFNEAVTPHATHFGMEVPNLGALAFLAGVLGRTSSPIAGAMVVVSGLAMVNPLEVAKRTIIPCFVAVILLAIFMV